METYKVLYKFYLAKIWAIQLSSTLPQYSAIRLQRLNFPKFGTAGADSSETIGRTQVKIILKFQNNKQNVESVATFQDQHQDSLRTIQQYLKETQSSTAGFTEHVRESLETLRENSSSRRTALLGHFTQGENIALYVKCHALAGIWPPKI